MIENEGLYRMLMRTAATARRIPTADALSVGERLPRGGGYGHILELLSVEEGLCQQKIAALAGIRPQSVSEAIGVMEARGLVRRECGVEDRRTLLVYLTEEGEAYRQRAARERGLKAERLFRELSEEEKDRLYQLLKKIQETNDGREIDE